MGREGVFRSERSRPRRRVCRLVAETVYDGGRPIEYIRYMGGLGQSSDRNSPSYNVDGLPLSPGVVELVTTNSAAPGGRHEGLPVGKVVIYSWPGPPADPTTHYSGARWMLTRHVVAVPKGEFCHASFPGLYFRAQHVQPFSRGGAVRDHRLSILSGRLGEFHRAFQHVP